MFFLNLTYPFFLLCQIYALLLVIYVRSIHYENNKLVHLFLLVLQWEIYSKFKSIWSQKFPPRR